MAGDQTKQRLDPILFAERKEKETFINKGEKRSAKRLLTAGGSRVTRPRGGVHKKKTLDAKPIKGQGGGRRTNWNVKGTGYGYSKALKT